MRKSSNIPVPSRRMSVHSESRKSAPASTKNESKLPSHSFQERNFRKRVQSLESAVGSVPVAARRNKRSSECFSGKVAAKRKWKSDNVTNELCSPNAKNAEDDIFDQPCANSEKYRQHLRRLRQMYDRDLQRTTDALKESEENLRVCVLVCKTAVQQKGVLERKLKSALYKMANIQYPCGYRAESESISNETAKESVINAYRKDSTIHEMETLLSISENKEVDIDWLKSQLIDAGTAIERLSGQCSTFKLELQDAKTNQEELLLAVQEQKRMCEDLMADNLKQRKRITKLKIRLNSDRFRKKDPSALLKSETFCAKNGGVPSQELFGPLLNLLLKRNKSLKSKSTNIFNGFIKQKLFDEKSGFGSKGKDFKIMPFIKESFQNVWKFLKLSVKYIVSICVETVNFFQRKLISVAQKYSFLSIFTFSC